MSKKPTHDIHQEVTNNIISLLDQVNEKDYQPPFAGMAAFGIPENPFTEKEYQGINILNLWFNQAAKSFQSHQWATFKQWKELGANVKKGSKGTRIIFYKTLLKEEENAKGEVEENKIPMLRQYIVFNADQVEGYQVNQITTDTTIDLVKRNALIEAFTQSTKADIRTKEQTPFYHTQYDYINMPDTALFQDTNIATATEHYYSTLLHELTHWTGAKKRLDREGINPECSKTKESYAFEELVAELGSAFLCSQFNLIQSQPKDHTIYIKNWLKALRNDKTFIFKAAAQATKATQYLNDLQGGLENDTSL